MSDRVARVRDGLSRRDGTTRPDDIVFCPRYNVPFHHETGPSKRSRAPTSRR
jgi:hypothetical protein